MNDQIHCPLDASPLTREPHGAAHFDHCPHCRGVWVSRMFLQGVANRSNTPAHWAIPAKVHRSEHLPCPQCSEPMLHRLQKNIQIDLCPSCKFIWLDGGEIAHISDSIKQARREKARASTKAALENSGRPISNVTGDSIAHIAVEGLASLVGSVFD